MRIPSSIIFLTVALTGCGQKEPTDPIDRVVHEESSNPMFFNGLHSVIHLPESASSEQLVSVASKQGILGNTKKIIETKTIQMTNEPNRVDSYLAVLAETDNGGKVILFQYAKEFGSTNKLDSGWIYRIYNN